MLERFEIQTVTEDRIVGAFTLDAPAFVKAVARSDAHEAVYESVECERLGRVHLEGLRPDVEYAITFVAGDEELSACTVKTLPAPQGEKHAEFVVMADPHVTTKPEMRHGRLLAESAVFLRQAVAEANACDADFVLIPGDVTNDGLPHEVALTKDILSGLNCPALLVAGDHDMHHARRHIYDTFGPSRWVEKRNGLTIIGCDIIDLKEGRGKDRMSFCLTPAGVDHILSALDAAEGTVILAAHRQLVPDDYIRDKTRAFGDWPLFEEAVLPKLPQGTIAYVGHKNLPSRFRRGNLLQINAPQLVQYPCGTLRVRCFENGIYHSYEPLFSELLNDASRMMSNALNKEMWTDTYRRGRSWAEWNFVSEPRGA